jgi:LmbE family N-acetylglucosaminyl deacetylase
MEHDLYLSAHCDDVAFSLGAHATQHPGGRLFTPFSRSNCINNGGLIETHGLDQLPPDARIMSVSSIRRAEDEEFARRAGLVASYGGLDEAPLRGRDPFDPAHAAEDAAALGPEIMGAIKALLPRKKPGRRPTLYCPIGIGHHLDHLVVRGTVLANLAWLRQWYGVVFYEDLPYAANMAPRREMLDAFTALVGPPAPRRRVLKVHDPAAKVELAVIYLSQHGWLPPPVGWFVPATGEADEPMHEALWLL